MICTIGNIRIVRVLVPLLAVLLMATGCQSVQARPPAAVSPGSTTRSPSASPSTPPSHVFVIVLENTSSRQALAQPYISSLASQYAVATNYRDLGNPSLPNYLAMTSGSTWGIRDDGYHRLPAAGVGTELTKAGITWKAYFEGFTGDCFNSPYPYALKHNPFAYYGGQCPTNVASMTQLASDLSGSTPQLSWITPGLCNDGHDCSLSTADNWLSQEVPQIVGSPAWQQGGVLLITWDEGSGGDDQVALLVITPHLKGQISTPMDHFGLLATIEDQLGVSRLGLAKQAASLTNRLKGSPAPSATSA